MPAEFSCDGAGASPPLEWSGAPTGTRAYALLVDDADGSATDWVIYNMPISISMLDVGIAARPLLSNGAQQGTNSHGTVGYDPVCPNRGDPPHHYAFQLYAVGDYITMQTGAAASEVKAALQGHTIASAQLTATYGR